MENTCEYKFDTDITSLMNIIINSVYSKKEIFLRELISNASDALDKAKYKLLTNNLTIDNELSIKIQTNTDNQTITITDSGIGMTRTEMIENIGTIARSGTKKFMEMIKDQKSDVNLIGQFGVGFYSAYLVADKVVVNSVSVDDNTLEHVWTSTADGKFTITSIQPTMKHGTTITLYIKNDSKEYLETDRIKKLVSEHSQYITYPIYVGVTEERLVDKDSADINISDASENKVEQAKEKVFEWKMVNEQKPIWVKNAADVTEDEYFNFFKNLNTENGFSTEYFKHIHFSMEGDTEFRSLLYIPKQPPFDLFDDKKKKSDIKLYVRRVFITDQSHELIPDYLRFVRGVVDSNDMPLNISREILQQSKTINTIKKFITKKVIEMISDVAETEPEKYTELYKAYSRNIKLGIHQDQKNRDKLIELLQLYSNTEKKLVHMKDYVNRMKPEQKHIYYLAVDNLEQATGSPFLEKLNKKGYEVLLLSEPIDEYAVQQIRTYKDKPLCCVSQEELDLGQDEDEKKQLSDQKEQFDGLCKYIKNYLGDKVEKVIVSDHITESPCILSTNKYGMSANMEKIMKAQALGNNDYLRFMKAKKVFEINPNNKIIVNLKNNLDDKDKVDNTISLLFDTALLDSGFNVGNMHEYSRKIHSMLERNN